VTLPSFTASSHHSKILPNRRLHPSFRTQPHQKISADQNPKAYHISGRQTADPVILHHLTFVCVWVEGEFNVFDTRQGPGIRRKMTIAAPLSRGVSTNMKQQGWLSEFWSSAASTPNHHYQGSFVFKKERRLLIGVAEHIGLRGSCMMMKEGGGTCGCGFLSFWSSYFRVVAGGGSYLKIHCSR